MKFEEQVASYYSKLRRRSRFFSSLMLVSGISLAAAAPFLSYEVSQIECAEKGSVVTPDFSNEIETLKNELEGKDETITKLEQKVEDKIEEISNLGSNPDCDILLQVIENDRDRLATELTEVTSESTVKDETITALEKEMEDRNEEISNLASNPDCKNIVQVIENDRDRLNEKLTGMTTVSVAKDKYIAELKKAVDECEEKLSRISNSEPDCGEFTKEINRLEGVITTKDRIIAQLSNTSQEPVRCPTVFLSGTFQYNELFTFNGNQFMVTYNSGDDVGARYKLMHDKKDVSSKIKLVNKRSIYTFKDSNKNSYRITFGKVVKTGIRYSLTSL